MNTDDPRIAAIEAEMESIRQQILDLEKRLRDTTSLRNTIRYGMGVGDIISAKLDPKKRAVVARMDDRWPIVTPFKKDGTPSLQTATLYRPYDWEKVK